MLLTDYLQPSRPFSCCSIKASSTRIRKSVKTQIFFFTNMACVHTYPAYFPAGIFFIRYEYVYVWTVVSGNFVILLDPVFTASIINKHGVQQGCSFFVRCLISSLISCVQINAAVINLHNQYIRDRQDVLRLSSMNIGRKTFD